MSSEIFSVPEPTPTDAITNCHKHNGLKQHKFFFFFHSSTCQKSKMHHPGLKPRPRQDSLPSEEHVSLPFPPLEAAPTPAGHLLPLSERLGAGHQDRATTYRCSPGIWEWLLPRNHSLRNKSNRRAYLDGPRLAELCCSGGHTVLGILR